MIFGEKPDRRQRGREDSEQTDPRAGRRAMAHTRPLILAALILAGGCDRRPDDRPSETSELSTTPRGAQAPALAERLDTYGYYLPVRPVQAGIYRLDYLHIGTDRPSGDWEEKTSGTYSPVILQFSDTSAAPTVSQLGRPTRTHVERVRPNRWRVTDTEVEFVDDQYRLGRVTFSGRIDQSALAEAKAGRADAPVLSGTLAVGGETFENVAFRWTAGS